jgi:hypothetical protein
LRAVKSSSDLFNITDGKEKKSESSTESKTLLPELMPIPNTETVLVDCPGLGELNNTRNDIAAAVVMQQILEKAKTVKIMVTVAHDFVRGKDGRTNFNNVLAKVLDFVKDTNKYKNSIELFVTKVESETVDDGNGGLIYKSDVETINEIGSFLNGVKTELMKKTLSDNVSRKIQLIDAFTTKNDKNEFKKIGIFGRPKIIGDLYLNPRLSENRNDMNRVIETGYTIQQSITK